MYNTASANNQETKTAQTVEVEKLKKVFCVILFMGIEKFPNRRLYWKSFTLSKFISDANISRNWLEEILSILHFNDKSLQKPVGDPNYKPLFKLKPTVGHLQNIFRTITIPETMVTVDEMMVALKVRHKLKCYMPQKPTKWRYKLWSLAGVSGYVYNCENAGENGAKGPSSGEPIINGVVESGYVVLRLADNLAAEKHKKLHVRLKENYFFSTLRVNRSRHFPLSSENNLQRKDRGAIEEVIDINDDTGVSAWFDNKRVVTMTNYLRQNPVSEGD